MRFGLEGVGGLEYRWVRGLASGCWVGALRKYWSEEAELPELLNPELLNSKP